jgi:hypothetical protein
MAMLRIEKKEGFIEKDLNPNLMRAVKKQCANWDFLCPSGGGGCLIGLGKPCRYFRDSVFPDFTPHYKYAMFPDWFPKLRSEYEFLYKVELDNPRQCKCGNALQKGKIYCKDCKETRRLTKYRKYNKSR